ncbi:MAG: hypothetical protein KME42_01070 [Tildeniella nuda ZEHNDER 1965/U140]|jgi:hypothetical protein|nr:hypothetical protein [Tildeniella nuda ZEHNDER 1965/U140]
MATKLIELENDILVEVEVPEDQARQISSHFADQVSSTVDKIKPVLVKICRPIAEVWREVNQEMQIEKAEIEINFGFEGEGNIYITKAKANANLVVKLVLTPKESLNK